MPSAIEEPVQRAPKPPPTNIYKASEPPFAGVLTADSAGFKQSKSDTAIVIDNGSSAMRAGWTFDKNPRVAMPPLMAKYKDRRVNRYYMFCGSDVFADGTARGQSKNAYEPGSNIINNWDVLEGVLDYCFIKLGLEAAEGRIDRPVLMTEPVANLPYARRTTNEILFECYGASKVSYGIDSLFSYRQNRGSSGLVVSSAYTSTHLIPVFEQKPLLSHTTRLNWGRWQSADYLNKLLKMKYPSFPARITDPQLEDLVKDHCYISQDYESELSRYLDWTGLEDREHIIQWPFTEQVVAQKTEEELARAAEKRKEGGRRLQEQAAKMRLEKLVRKEQELEYYKQLQERVQNSNKKEGKRLLESDDFDDDAQLERRVKDMERSIKRARNKDVGDMEPEPEVPHTYPLLDIADDQLDEEGLKQKRQQRLLKSNHDARARAKAEKERERLRKEEEERQDAAHREANPQEWLSERHALRRQVLQRMKDRARLKADLSNRKSIASQMRMKSIANLASDNPTKKRRRGGGDDDTFGADDADWGVYRTIATGEGSDDEEEETDLNTSLKAVEAQLLQYDPNFTEESTRDAQSDWSRSLIHSFLHGPRPHDPESQREAHQVHLNVERIRVPEVVFQPSIAGLDQAGVVEIAADILTQRLPDQHVREALLRDVFLTGGNVLFEGFEERVKRELRACLPVEAQLGVRMASDPRLDAWRGAARWANEKQSGNAWVTRQEFEEMGSEYIKEHDLGNAVG
ncbi:MAG: hypothetical protein Q9162_002291 [Coniocarpon cinnabarinum]